MNTPRRTYTQSSRASTTERTRQRILASAREQFYAAAYDDVTLSTIATAAGVTQQTVLNHYGSKENLFGVLVELVDGEVTQRRATAPAGDVVGALRVLLEEYEEIGDSLIRFLALEERLPVLETIVESGRATHRAWLERVFAAELPAGGIARRRTVTALYAATDLYVWKLLRRDLGTSLVETSRVMRRLIAGALTT